VNTRPRTKALKADQLKGELKGDLAAYEKFGLFQRSVNQNTAYRYRGALLRYQLFLGENPPSLAATCEYLGLLRKNNFDPSTLHVYRAALAGYHQWRGEELKFKVKVPETSAKYVPWEIIQRILELASTKPHDQLILRLMTDAGLRRDEVVKLKISNVEGRKLRFRGKGGKERTVPMTDELKELVDQFSASRSKDASLVELGEKGVYMMVKRYGALAGMPEIAPHDLRRAFGTHLLNVTGNIRIVQEILGHSNVNTTQAYTAVTFNNMEEAINKLNRVTGHIKKTGDLQTTEEKETVSRHETYDEPPHRRQIRELARATAEGIHLPSTWDKELWRDLPIDFQSGKYYLSIGAVEIKEDKQLKVKYFDIGTGVAAPHLVRGLFSHFSTSGSSKFTELVGEKGKLSGLVFQAGQYSQALLELLKLIADEAKGYRTQVDFHGEGKLGLTKWFIISVWNDVIQKACGYSWIDNSWYKPYENVLTTNHWQLRGGGAVIGIAKSERTLKIYETLHKKLILKYAIDPLTKDIATKDQELGIVVQDIKQRLQEFSDMQQIPGHCELC
jgi:site-specific recombinase XerD